MTKYAVLGTGNVGRALAARLAGLGNDVVIGTRNINATLSRKDKETYGPTPFSEWYKTHENIRLVTFAEAALYGEILINATKGTGSIDSLKSADEKNMSGKVLIDISNPLDFSNGFPPSFWVCNTDSLGEQIQRTFPTVKVVKSLNTVTANLMVNPAQLKGDHTVFISGNDTNAKSTVQSLLRSIGWKDKNIVDLGDITTARGTEMYLSLWISLMTKLQKPMFNINLNTDIAG